MKNETPGVDVEFWRSLQGGVLAWAERNFPRSIGRPEDALAGIVEELGELAEALAKRDREGVQDAVADAMIFGADFCGKIGEDLGMVVQRASGLDENDDLDERDDQAVGFRLLGAVGRVHHHFLKRRQDVRTNEDHPVELRRWLVRLVSILWDVHDVHRQDLECPFDASVRMTWERVRRRDWRADRVNGGEKR